MAFKNYFSVGARRVVGRRKGRADGRLTGVQFDKLVRAPFRDRVMMTEMNGGRKKGAYNALDSNAIRQELRGARQSGNYAHLASQRVLRQISAERRDLKRGGLPSSTKRFPIQ
ncbi:hypothetical protein NESM_000420700 [Novymonas esmeraldas]|uniref:Uncharacterized protein n=1 Tax=Novymonas esmeraldas TaxID=1808958 RepID=A0AAW0EP56_9TRYP